LNYGFVESENLLADLQFHVTTLSNVLQRGISDNTYGKFFPSVRGRRFSGDELTGPL